MDSISTEAFSKSKNNSWLATEASLIEWPPLYAPQYITLKSEWTDRQITLEKVHTERDLEGDVVLWMYKPANREGGVELTVEVFND